MQHTDLQGDQQCLQTSDLDENPSGSATERASGNAGPSDSTDTAGGASAVGGTEAVGGTVAVSGSGIQGAGARTLRHDGRGQGAVLQVQLSVSLI